MDGFAAWFHRRYHREYRRARALLVVDMVLLAAIIGIAAGTLLYLWALRDVSIAVISSDGASGSRAGDAVERRILITNPSSAPLYDVALALDVPPEVELVGAALIEIAELAAQSSTDVPIVARVWGMVGDERSIGVSSVARDGEGRVDRAFGSVLFHIERPAIALDVELPDRVLVGQRIIPSFVVRSQLEEPVSELIVSVRDFSGIAASATEHVVSTDERAVDLFEGTIDAEHVSFSVDAAIVRGGTRIIIDRAAHERVAERLPVELSVSLDAPLDALSDGGLFAPRVSFVNASDFAVRDVVVSLAPRSSCVALRAASLVARVVLAQDRFERLLPTTVSFSCAAARGEIDIASFVSFRVDGFDAPVTLAGPVLSFGVSASPEATARVRYFSSTGDQLGRGPVPPRAGEESKLWVFIDLSSDFGTILGPTFSAQLAPYATWTGRTTVSSGDAIIYDASARLISWDSAVLHDGDHVTLGFEVALTPPSDGVHPLVQHATFSGQDRGSRTIISVPLSITSDLSDDPFVF